MSTVTALNRTGALPRTTANPNLLRVLSKLAAGTAIKVAFIGDSGLEGLSVTTPGTDDVASKFCAGLTARFGASVTKSNRAVGGHTPYFAMDPSLFSPTKFALALADAADLYVISYGHNDIRSDIIGVSQLPGTGYPVTASRAAVEHMVRRIRLEVPEADIIISNEWPYTNASVANNPFLLAHGNTLRRVAAQYGCAFVDYYQHLLGLGVLSGKEDTYIWPVGGSGTNINPQHPNDAGHAAWADALLATLPKATKVPANPAVPPLAAPLFGAERYTHAGWLDVPLLAGPVLPARWRIGSGWSSSTTPTTTSTAASFVEIQAIGTEVSIRLDLGAGQGVIKVEVDGAVTNATLDLSTLGSGQSRLPITGLSPGAHRIVVTVVSGSLTYRGASYLPCLGQKIPYNSALLTYTGTWADVGTDSSAFERNSRSTTTLGDTVTVSFVGTGLAFSGYRYAAVQNVGVTVDGGTEAVQDWNNGGTLSQHAGKLIVSGLSYGRHTVILRQAGPTGTRVLTVSNFFAFDEQRTTRSGRSTGVAVVGEAVSYGNSLPSVPALILTPDDATSTVPASTTASTVAGFTPAGTASAKQLWLAEHGRAAY